MNSNPPSAKYGAWNPGLEPELPREYVPLSTIFRSENVSTSVAKARELSDYCGLPVHELVAFRADRLIVHELLIHVTTGISVPDGRGDEDLGRNFRGIAATILNQYIAPRRDALARIFEQLHRKATVLIERELAEAFAEPPAVAAVDQPSDWRRLFAFGPPKKPAPKRPETVVERDRRIVSGWQTKSE